MTEKIKDSDQARQADQAKHQARHPHHENLLAQGKQIAVDIRAEIARLKSEPAWAANDRHGSSLVKGDGINVALMMLKKGAKLQEHHTRADHGAGDRWPRQFYRERQDASSDCGHDRRTRSRNRAFDRGA